MGVAMSVHTEMAKLSSGQVTDVDSVCRKGLPTIAILPQYSYGLMTAPLQGLL